MSSSDGVRGAAEILNRWRSLIVWRCCSACGFPDWVLLGRVLFTGSVVTRSTGRHRWPSGSQQSSHIMDLPHILLFTFQHSPAACTTQTPELQSYLAFPWVWHSFIQNSWCPTCGFMSPQASFRGQVTPLNSFLKSLNIDDFLFRFCRLSVWTPKTALNFKPSALKVSTLILNTLSSSAD